MGSQKTEVNLKRVQASDLQHWLRLAWKNQSSYPDIKRCNITAMQINTLVESRSSAPQKSASEEAVKERRKNHQIAARHARALNRALGLLVQNLQGQFGFTTTEGIPPYYQEIACQISTMEQAQAAVKNFLDLPLPPKSQDLADPVLWLAHAVEEAWHDILDDASSGQKKKMFSHFAGGPLVNFIDLALAAIGLAGVTQWDNRLDTISDHLRQRHKRRRGARGAKKKLGQLDTALGAN